MSMRILRRQLMDLLEEARHQQGMEVLPKRLQAALVHDTLKLLPHPGKPGSRKRVALHLRSISHGALHRHLITIRCPDQAFYMDAVKGYLLRNDIQPISQQTMVAAMHCDDELCDIFLRHPDQQSDDNFMFIALHISATLMPDCTTMYHDINATLRAVDLSVRDFHPMLEKLTRIVDKMKPDNASAAALLDWMIHDKYLIFGLQMNDVRLGLMRDYRAMESTAPGLKKELQDLPPASKAGIEWLHLAACQHYLYSAANVEAVRLSWLDQHGKLSQTILIGHFSRSARHVNASQLPSLDKHWQALQKRSILKHSAFYRREIRTLYDRLPKPLLHAIEPSQWLAPLKGIIDLTSPTQTLSAHLHPAIGNLDYLLIAMPANRYGPNVLRHIEANIAALAIAIHSTESFGIGPYRIIILAVETGPDSDTDAIAEAVNRCIVFWKDKAKKALLAHADEFNLPDTLHELEQLPPLYQELFPPGQFIADIRAKAYVLSSCRTLVRVHLRHSTKDQIELHIITCNPMPLGELVDKIQAFGLIAIQEAVVDFGHMDKQVRISCIRCKSPRNLQQEDLSRLRRGLELVFNDEADHDAINALLTATTMDIGQIAILIALRNHLVQIMPDAAPTPLSNMLIRYPEVVERLMQLLAARHLPSMPADYFSQVKMEFEQAMTNVHSLTDDRWFRALEQLIEATVRTNAFVRQTEEPIAFKIAPDRLEFAPHPRPYREIFVHGVHVEGIHLRAGPVARGGIRYSDRPADFRTEVLDLMSTQTVKNGQIVPTGAKGGFVVRGGSGPDFVRQQYRLFIRTLLDITDNLVHGEAIAPDGMHISEHDQNDPYLVVAADKGTARYSDDANEESRLACFWLDDAFASGGSQGYDHKAIGITARGAWVCAAHHFSLLGVDAYNDPIRVVAIGDMAGDVFGNGMLLNPNMKLIGAFNHRHIFLDPEPNTKKAFTERKRLFAETGGWDAYDTSLISKGGGVFMRSSKSIPLSAEASKALGIEASALSGEALIQALLCADVDLLYNGGIGTYIKASDETHQDVQDPANNHVRVNASELRATVICEGGNLGLTQKARIEYAQDGGIINTDAIDNAAGVDMSDHEVNLKILFAAPSLSGITVSKRNQILKKIQETVTEQCLDNNLMQSRALSLAAYDADEHLPRLMRLRDTLIHEQRILPGIDAGMEEDATLSLKPQLAVLLGHEKNRIHEALDQQGFEARSCFRNHMLRQYFPATLWRRYEKAMLEHALVSGIIHTHTTNHIINHYGLVSVHHLQSLLDKPVSDIVQSLLVAEALLNAEALRNNIWASITDMSIVTLLQRNIQEYIMHFAEELLRLCPVQQLDLTWIQKQQRGLNRFCRSLGAQGIGGAESSRYLELLKSASQAGLSAREAKHMAAMPELTQMATAVHISASANMPLSTCLKATQAAIHLLPFQVLETSLRSQSWGDPDAHILRCEWLHRLTLLKQRAVNQLLEHSTLPFIESGTRRWGAHRHWPDLQEAVRHGWATEAEHETDEHVRMRLILTLTHLESVIDES